MKTLTDNKSFKNPATEHPIRDTSCELQQKVKLKCAELNCDKCADLTEAGIQFKAVTWLKTAPLIQPITPPQKYLNA